MGYTRLSSKDKFVSINLGLNLKELLLPSLLYIKEWKLMYLASSLIPIATSICACSGPIAKASLDDAVLKPVL